jgi:ferric-dicitrate binding protein FerR (iron transport regulator)
MSRLEELLLKFQDGSLGPEEVRELSALLERPETRAAVVEDFFLTSAIRSHLRAAPERRVASRRFVRTRRSVSPLPSGTWAWAAAALLAAMFVVLLSSSRDEAPRPVTRMLPTPAPVPEKPTPPKVEPEPEVRPVPALPRPEPPPSEPLRTPTPPPEPAPRVEPQPPPPPPASPAPEPARPPRSQVVGIARIEKVEGTAFVVAKEGKSPAVAGTEFAVGQGLDTTGVGSRIVLVFPDKTQVELGPDSTLTDIKLDPAATRLALATGTIRADVAPQPKIRPLIVATPHAEAKVLGTTLRVVADRDPKKGTLLEVDKGRVELKRLADRKSVMVGSGQFAVAAVGVDLKPRPLSPNVPMARFTFDDGKTSPEWIGTVAAGPARPGNTGCLEGRYLPEERLTRTTLSDDANGLFYHRDGAVLNFEYWADGDTSILSVYLWNRTQSLSMGQCELRNLTRRQWTRVTVPLGDLRAGDKRLEEGDFVKNLTIQTNQGKGVLFVDNVEIAVPRSK